MAAGVTDHLWEMSEVVALLDEQRAERIQHGREKAAETMIDPTTRLDRPLGQ